MPLPTPFHLRSGPSRFNTGTHNQVKQSASHIFKPFLYATAKAVTSFPPLSHSPILSLSFSLSLSTLSVSHFPSFSIHHPLSTPSCPPPWGLLRHGGKKGSWSTQETPYACKSQGPAAYQCPWSDDAAKVYYRGAGEGERGREHLPGGHPKP